MSAELILAYDRKDEIRRLFSEYTDMLVRTDPIFAHYLDLQGYDDEIRDLDKKYGPPDGRLYLALCGEKPAGCIALRRLNETDCEMKRLYVRPEFRGTGAGRALACRIIEDARKIGYKRMLLDTLPVLAEAVSLYRSLGFCETECYNNSPVESTLFMRLDL